MSQLGAGILFLVLGIATPAFGQSSCLPDYTALQTIENVDAGASFARQLQSRNSNGYFQTRVRLEGEVDSNSQLGLMVRFDPAFEGVSLPYNLYSVLVVSEGEVLAWLDFTRDCSGPGLSFFPGRQIRLPAIKLIGGRPQKLQIMVWGKL